MLEWALGLSAVVIAVGYKNPDDNPSWVAPVLTVGFIVALVLCVLGYLWVRARTR